MDERELRGGLMRQERVLFNDLALYRQRSGIGYYATELLRHFFLSEPRFEVVPLSRTIAGGPLKLLCRLHETGRGGTAGEAADRGRVRAEWMSRLKQVGFAGLDRYCAGVCRLGGFALYHEPDAIPLAIDAPTVATVHDLSVLLFPDWHPKHRVLRYESALVKAVERTRLLVVDADSTKRELVASLGVEPSRIRVVPLAPRPAFRVLPAERIDEVRARLNLPDQFLLFVSTIEPRKNVVGLLHAYAMLRPGERSRVPLLLAGGWGWKSEPVREMLARLPWSESVRWLGYLSDADLVAVTNAALALVYPSHYEGFGLPPLEAMACGRPVITTHTGSLKEVIGDAALIVDPNDVDQLAQTLSDIVDDQELRDEYSGRGRRHASRYSWARTVHQTVEAYREAA